MTSCMAQAVGDIVHGHGDSGSLALTCPEPSRSGFGTSASLTRASSSRQTISAGSWYDYVSVSPDEFGVPSSRDSPTRRSDPWLTFSNAHFASVKVVFCVD